MFKNPRSSWGLIWNNHGYQLVPRGSMYGIFTYIYHKNHPNVGRYTIHGWYGVGWPATMSLRLGSSLITWIPVSSTVRLAIVGATRERGVFIWLLTLFVLTVKRSIYPYVYIYICIFYVSDNKHLFLFEMWWVIWCCCCFIFQFRYIYIYIYILGIDEDEEEMDMKCAKNCFLHNMSYPEEEHGPWELLNMHVKSGWWC